MPAGILLIDDHTLFRQGLKSLLQGEGFEIIAEAEDGRNAVKLATKLKPGAVIMDISMPGLNGIDATKQICREWPGAKVIVMSMHRDGHFVLAALKAGAAGYLLKDSAFDELVVALNSVLRGYMYLSPAVAEVVVKSSVSNSASTRRVRPDTISNREREVLQLLVEGRSAKEIAAALYVSVKTIETHRTQIMKKLNLNSIAALTKYAVREGVTSL
ncbi:MAG TPA: response regulator transcription factor [Methylomirabilota bacterium]|nr:response regulator transcription factor [Methylomirabilota bacterium]